MKLTKHFGKKRKLRRGTRVRVRVTAPDRIGTPRSRSRCAAARTPKVVRRCVPAGTTELRKVC